MRQIRNYLMCCCCLVSMICSGADFKISTHNTLTIGDQGTAQYNALEAVIGRTCPNIILIQEIADEDDITNFENLAMDAGYSYYENSDYSSLLAGGLRTGCISSYPIISSVSWSSAEISGDSNAVDISRDIFQCRISLGSGQYTGVITVHLKATGDEPDLDKFRRQIEIIRLIQVITIYRTSYPSDYLIIGGDFNEDYSDGPFGSPTWTTLPAGLPGDFRLGSDISFPITYNPFQTIFSAGLTMIDATWEDTTSTYTTRPASGRRLDYLFWDGDITISNDEVYYSTQDDGIDDPPVQNMPKCGAVLSSGTSMDASDHLPVVARITYQPGTPLPTPTAIPGGSLLISEVLYNPSGSEPAAEWIELYNCTDQAISLSGYIIADEESFPASGTEGACVFPSSASIPAFDTVLIAIDGATFNSENGFYPDFEIDPAGIPVTSVMTPVQGFGSISLGNSTDEIGLFDISNSFIDSCEWGAATPVWATTRHGGVANGQSLERCPSCNDTNNCSIDFVLHSENGNPGGTCDTPSSTSTPSPSPTPTRTPTASATATRTPTPMVTSTPQSTVTPPPTGSLLIVEVLYDSSGYSEPSSEWLEIYNCGGVALDISGYIITDEEIYPTPTNEGAAAFPAGSSIGPGSLIVIANQASMFQSIFGFAPDYEIIESDAGVPNLIPVEEFNTIQLANDIDEIALFNNADQIIDSCEWGSGTAVWASVRHSDVIAGSSLERCPVCQDTQDCSLDFVAHTNNGSPGSICAESTPSPTSTVTRTPTATRTATSSPTTTHTPAATPAVTHTPTSASTSIPTPTGTPPPVPAMRVTGISFLCFIFGFYFLFSKRQAK